MGRQAIRLAKISPADIIAEADTPEGFDAVYDSPRALEGLEYAIIDAVTNRLPDDLIVTETADINEPRVWHVLQALNPATKTIGARGLLEDDATAAHVDAIAWLTQPSRVAEVIGFDSLAREATRGARLALEADV